MNITCTENEVMGQIDIKASPEKVFHALTNPHEWWGTPEMYTVTHSSFDCRPGGAWISEGKNAGGEPFHVKGTIVECDPPRLLSHTWNPSWETEMPETTVTYRLEPIEGGTRLHLTHGSFAGHDNASRDHYQGWTKVIGWLVSYVEKG